MLINSRYGDISEDTKCSYTFFESGVSFPAHIWSLDIIFHYSLNRALPLLGFLANIELSIISAFQPEITDIPIFSNGA